MTSSDKPAASRVEPPFSELSEWLGWQETAAPKEIDLGLDRCRKVARSLNIDLGNAIVVTVAGTNGKGSSVAMLERTWITAGYNVAAYTSPHMIAYNERMRFGGVPLSSDKICGVFQKIEEHRGDTHLTYFEYGTLAALSLFQELEPDIIILEVGLGGRLDAVNIIDPDVSLITSIGIDHVEFLGSNRESIGFEKAGIMRRGRPAVCSDPNVPNSVVEHANTCGANLEVLGVGFRFVEQLNSWDWWNANTELLGLPKPNLEGDYQFRNASGVLQVLDLLQKQLPVPRAIIETMLSNITLWGRFQRFPGEIEYIFDVAHNVQAVEQFAATLNKLGTTGTVHLVLGMLKTKDRTAVMRILQSVVDRWYLASVTARRGATSQELYDSLKESGGGKTVDQFPTVIDALDAAKKAAIPGDRIVALGSFLVVSDALRYINKTDNFTDFTKNLS